MTQTPSTNRLFVLSALFAASAMGLLHEVSVVYPPNVSAMLVGEQVAAGRLTDTTRVGQRELSSAERRRRLRMATGRSSSSVKQISAFRARVTSSVRSRFTFTSSAGTHAAASSAVKAGCGDGIMTGSETCDDGNVIANDGCSATCTVEHGFVCFTNTPTTCQSDCGDGVVATNEKCDDANVVNADGCDSACRLEVGWTCTGEKSVCSPKFAVCGDGLVAGAEACDDGDSQSNDGCSSTCTVEAGYTCSGNPSVCQ